MPPRLCSEPIANVRTIYTKGLDGSRVPADSIRLPNYGREQHGILTHIVSRYDNGLADRTVFMHADEPSFGFFVPGQPRHGGHLLLNVSALDYMTFDAASPTASAAPLAATTPSTFMPVTLRSDAHLTLMSFRATAADIEDDGRRALQRPVSTFPTDAADDGWLPYERFNMAGFARRISRHPEPLSFEAFFVDLFGRPPPAVGRGG